MVDTVESLISSMELAAELDNTANEAQKPAVNKIKMLASVENAVGQTYLHKELLDAGFLGALKLWIEPLPDFSLPNVKVDSSSDKDACWQAGRAQEGSTFDFHSLHARRFQG